jgi:hypothetical protein
MQLTPLGLLVSQCDTLTRRLEALDAKCRRATVPQPLFAISELQTDLQRIYAIEQVLMRLEALTSGVQVEVADAIWDLLETIGMTYRPRGQIVLRHPEVIKRSTSTRRGATMPRATAKGVTT